MDLKQGVVIVSKFGTQSAGNYILRYTSRTDAVESLAIDDYITKYSTRYGAVEQLKTDAPTDNEVWARDEALMRKDGVLFGNRGLSYTDAQLREAARVTQKASDAGHVVIMPVISFSHDYLQARGVVPKDMPPPKEAGGYRGQVDQLKLRGALTEMMGKMHQDMGFTAPEWTGTIQVDTTHVHAHMTTVETGQPKPKRMKRVRETVTERVPDMQWQDADRTSDYKTTVNADGCIEYVRDGAVVATQSRSQKGTPKWFRSTETTEATVLVERGVINDTTKSVMRKGLDRGLARTQDVKPFVQEITARRQLTRTLSLRTAAYNDATVAQLQALRIALPENKKMWRAGSRAKDMTRAHEIAHGIVDDLWTKYEDGVQLDAFDTAVREYISVRASDEGLDQAAQDELYENAYNRLRTETVNGLYKEMGRVPERDNILEIPRHAIQAADTDMLKNEIADSFRRAPRAYDGLIGFEYRQRAYRERYQTAAQNARYFEADMREYDGLRARGATSPESRVVRDYFESEYDYNRAVADKYAYLRGGSSGGVSKDRFDEVRGVDLVNMLYDYGKGADRSVPREMADAYAAQTELRVAHMHETMRYLITTGQLSEYDRLREARDALHEEAGVARVIQTELSLPTPTRVSERSFEKRKTVDTVRGRRLLKAQLTSIETRTTELAADYAVDAPLQEKEKVYRPSQTAQEKVVWSQLDRKDSFAEQHAAEQRRWAQQKAQFDRFLADAARRQAEEEAEAEVARETEARSREAARAARLAAQTAAEAEYVRRQTAVPAPEPAASRTKAADAPEL